MKRRLTALLLALHCTLVVAATGTEERKPEKVRYVAPDGFAGHKWGDLRSSFDRLPEQPVGVGAAWMRPKETQTDVSCVPVNPNGPQSGAIGGCDFYATLLRIRRNFQGGGTYVLSEYSIDGQGFQFGEEAEGIVLHPVVYQFCANWGQTKKSEPPPDFDAINKFCGVKFMFQSETREELSKLPDEHVTTYDRVLEKLLAKYGRPQAFKRRGKVIIETIEGESSDPADRKFSIWRWCPSGGKSIRTACDASVVLALDPVTGVGTVLYSTPELWEFAWAREHYGFEGDRLYRILNGRDYRPD
jgi:hypothetical protein